MDVTSQLEAYMTRKVACVKISNNLLKHNYTNIVKCLFYMEFYQKAWNFEKNLYPVMEFEGDFESLGTIFLPNS